MKKIIVAFFTVLLLSNGLWAQSSQKDKSGVYVHSVDISFQHLFPLGDYATLTKMGLGGNLRLDVGIKSLPWLRPFFEAGALAQISNTSKVDTLLDIPVLIGAGFYYQLDDLFEIGGRVGYGLLPHIITGDYRGTGKDTYVFLDYGFQFSLEASYLISSPGGMKMEDGGLAVVVGSDFVMFPEQNSKLGMEVGYRLGLRFLF